MKITAFLIFVFIYLNGIAQLGFNDFEFKGKVKSTNQYHYYYSNDTITSVNTHNNFYSNDGRLLKQIQSHSYKDSLIYAVISNLYYDSLKRFVHSITSDSSSITKVIYPNNRDAAKIITYLSYSKDTLTNKIIVKFNSKNQTTATSKYDYRINKYEQEYYIHKQFKKGKLKEIYTYNTPTDRLIRFNKSYTSESGSKVESNSENYITGDKSSTVSIYDTNKNLISFTIAFNNGIPFTTTYEYSNIDKNGNWLTKKSYSDGKLHYKIEREIEYWE
jgi:hypothetical protein